MCGSIGAGVATYEGYEAWKRWPAEEFARFDEADRAYFEAEFAAAGLRPVAPSNILELGFGNGAFAGWARSRGFSYTGVEQSAELVRRAREAGFRALSTSDDLWTALAEHSLDVVVAFDVFEHLGLDDLRSLLSTLRGKLVAGGVVLARVPSGDSPFGRAILHGDLTHRTALGSSAVHQLAVLCGLEVVAIRPPQLPVRGLGLRRGARRLALRGAQNFVGRAINLAFHDGEPRVITANMVFTLRRGY